MQKFYTVAIIGKKICGEIDMNILEKYEAAFNEYKAKNFDESLKILKEVQAAAPNWKKANLLEAYILREKGETVEEFLLVQKFLSSLEIKSPEEKFLASVALNLFGLASLELSMPESSVEFLRLSAELSENYSAACVEISNAILSANSSENFSEEDFKKLYAEYKKYLSDITPYPKKFYNHKKIRVGFLSSDFYNHPVIKWVWALIYKLDKKFFATYCYSARKDSDVITKNVKVNVENWRDISDLQEEQAVKLIREDEIDILFDLSGHTSGNRLRVAAYRPATVQISGIGYMNSTGLDCFDYFLSDEICAGGKDYFTEKLIRMSHSHICFEKTTGLEVSPPPCLKKNFVTFGTFNQFKKITDSILLAWKKILDAVPNSRLILKNKLSKKDSGKEFIANRLKNFGIDIARVEMRNFTANYLREYDDVDIALDTFPYTGGVTTCEALYMGVPVISLYGKRHGSRFGLSILKNIGLDELAVNSYEDYINRAVALANDWELLTILRKNLRDMMTKSPLMDSENYIREIEAKFMKIMRDAQ